MGTKGVLLAGLLLWPALFAAGTSQAGERQRVDMELLLAVDVSHSISADEHRLQIAGIAAAFRSSALIEAIASRGKGRIAVAVMFWAGTEQQVLAVPWQVVDGPQSAARLAAAITRNDSKPWPGVSYTAIGSALLRAADAIEANAYDAPRLVVDLSADDPSNQGIAAEEARDRLVARGIVVNGLPILTNRQEMEDKEALVQHFEQDVSGGDGAFVIPAESFHDVPRAILSKLITEVAGLAPPPARLAGALR